MSQGSGPILMSVQLVASPHHPKDADVVAGHLIGSTDIESGDCVRKFGRVSTVH